jgi:hypothetical protein
MVGLFAVNRDCVDPSAATCALGLFFVEGTSMAQKVVVSLVDDIDGGRAAETVQFALDGKNYEIDLSETNAAALREALAKFVEPARRAGSGGTRRGRGTSSAPRSSSDREQNQAIRDWAREHGHKVSDRGRIPSEVIEAYQQAS